MGTSSSLFVLKRLKVAQINFWTHSYLFPILPLKQWYSNIAITGFKGCYSCWIRVILNALWGRALCVSAGVGTEIVKLCGLFMLPSYLFWWTENHLWGSLAPPVCHAVNHWQPLLALGLWGVLMHLWVALVIFIMVYAPETSYLWNVSISLCLNCFLLHV